MTRDQTVLSFDFHVHTNYSSDGYNSFRQLHRRAVNNKIDVLAITDHDTIEGAVRFKDWLEINYKTDLQVIIGEEVTCCDGTHIIGLFVENKIQATQPLEVVEEIRQQGALVYFPHPARHDGILKSIYCKEAIAQGDFYECFNGKCSDDYNYKAYSDLNDVLLPLGGSDGHYNSDIGKCICILEASSGVFSTVSDYKVKRRVVIKGHRKPVGAPLNYFPLYYKYKNKINLPMFVRNFAKALVPSIKNFAERKHKPVLDIIYENIEK